MSVGGSSPPPTASQPSAVAAHSFLSSFDLLSHSCSLLSLADLLTLTTVSRLLHSVADSDQVWRPRLQSATKARHTKPAVDTDEQMTADSEQKTDDDSSSNNTTDEPMTVCTCSQQHSADTAAASSCKAQYLGLFQCVYHTHSRCRRLVAPQPLLLVNRGPRGSMVAMMRARRSAGISVAVSAGELHCVQSVCRQCVGSLATAVKDFYDMRSEWAGSFTMTPVSVVPVPRSMVDGPLSETELAVDVRYWHVGGYEDVDHRRFTFEWRRSHTPPPPQQQPQPVQHATTQPAPAIISLSQPQSQQPQTQPSDEDNKAQPTPPTSHNPPAVQPTSAADPIQSSSSPPLPIDDSDTTTSDADREPDIPWHVLSMAPFCSGKWAFHSPPNVVVTDALRYSRLARTQQPRQRGIPARVIGAFAAVVPARRSRNGQSSR